MDRGEPKTDIDHILMELDKLDDEILDLAEQDCFGDYQFGRRDGLYRAHDLIAKFIRDKRNNDSKGGD